MSRIVACAFGVNFQRSATDVRFLVFDAYEIVCTGTPYLWFRRKITDFQLNGSLAHDIFWRLHSREGIRSLHNEENMRISKWVVVYAVVTVATLMFTTSPGMAKKKGGGGGGGNAQGVAVSLSTDGTFEATADVSIEKENDSVACGTLAATSPGYFAQTVCGSGNGWKTYSYSITANGGTCTGSQTIGIGSQCNGAILNAF
jgi:hypothetical protein